MKVNALHPWDVSLEQASIIQKSLYPWIVIEDFDQSIKHVARIKVITYDDNKTTKSTCSIFDAVSLELVDQASAIHTVTAPKLTTQSISFVQAPAVIKSLAKIKHSADFIICDGTGVTSNNRFGLASHIGLLTNQPCIGLSFDPTWETLAEPAGQRGSWMPVPNAEGILGVNLRVFTGNPCVQVYPGHKINQKSAIRMLLRLIPINFADERYMRIMLPYAKQFTHLVELA